MSENATETWTLVGSLGAAAATAVCCLGPVVLVSLGVGGAWIGSLSALEAYRPFFMLAAVGLLGTAFYRTYAPFDGSADAAETCEEDEACEVPAASRTNRAALWIATVVVAGLFAIPYVLGPNATADASADAANPTSAARTDGAGTDRTTLVVDGMTCGGCARTVTSALEDLEGVRDAQVTLEPPRATVVYDRNDISVETLTKATADLGFPSRRE